MRRLPRAALGLVALAGALAAAGCGRGSPSAPDTATQSWFVLREGALEASPGAPTIGVLTAGSAGETDPHYVPWTVQERIADLTARGGELYVGVNGYGVAHAPFPLAAGSTFATVYAPGTFAGRTLTEMLTDSSGLILHVYANRTLAESLPGGPSPGGEAVSLVAYREDATGLTPLTVPFQAEHPDWEAVAVVRTSASELAMEWKHTDPARTEFAYTRLAWRRGTEVPSDRAAFRDAYRFMSISSPGVETSTRALFQAVLRHLEKRGAAGSSTAVHLVIRREGVEAERYRYEPPGYADADDVDLVAVPARGTDSALWALSGDGALLGARRGSTEVMLQTLPPLPDGYRYTGFALVEDPARPSIAASWEEVRFMKVGEAGLYAGPIRVPGR